MTLRILIALGLTTVVAFALQLGFDLSMPGWAVVALYLLLYFLIEHRDRKRGHPDDADDAEPDRSRLPISGPIGRFGPYGLMASFFGSQLLMLFNPFQLLQSFRQIAGITALQAREKKTGDDGRGYRSKARYRLPFDGEWLLYNGGMTPKTSHSWDVPGQRFALDFVVCDVEFKRHSGRGTQVTDYFAYGLPIRAAADGEVVAVENRIGIAPLVGWGLCDVTARSFIGNHVLIRHADGEYGLYAHLIRGSIEVRVGDQVWAGQTLGCCGHSGHSGHSSEPHLHFHLQDSADLFKGMGLPITFHDIEIDGQRHETAQPTAMQRVGNAAEAATTEATGAAPSAAVSSTREPSRTH